MTIENNTFMKTVLRCCAAELDILSLKNYTSIAFINLNSSKSYQMYC